MDLFPTEQPYVVAKLEDGNGFSLSNGSQIGDFIANGQMVYAEPEGILDPSQQKSGGESVPLHGGQNALELVTMLNSLQYNILHKLAIS